MKIIKKISLLLLFCLSLSTLLLTWQNVSGVQTLNGTVILTGNMCLSAIIIITYFMSVLFYEQAQQVFLCLGISSLSMLFAIMVSKFEVLGRFSNGCIGPYLGIAGVLLTAFVFIFWNIKEKR